MKKIIPLFALLLGGCSGGGYETFSGFEQGTTYTIIANSRSKALESDISAVFDTIDNTFSMFNPHSLTSRINRNETDSITPLFEECFTLAKKIHAASEGFFDPTVAPLIDAWGFGPGKQQREPNVDSLMEFVGFDKIFIANNNRIIKQDPRVQLDFSSIAKGFTVDRLAQMLDSRGVTDYMVEVGGEVRAKGVNATGKRWRIGIDKPAAGLQREIEAVVEPSEDFPAVATSGNYRNFFTDESGRERVHTIDPKTGFPIAGEILSASIAAPSCALADGLATGVMACGTFGIAQKLLSNAHETQWYMIFPGGTDHSDGFPLAE